MASSADSESANRLWVACLLVALGLALCTGFFVRRTQNWNEASRLGLVFAAVEEGSLTIDSFHEAQFTSTQDKAHSSGHYYSDKAIGTSVLGILAYAPLRPVLRAFIPGDGAAWFHARRYLITFAAVGVPTAIAGALFFWLCRRGGSSGNASVLLTVFATLGTPIWPFATLFFGHALAAALLLGAFALVRCLPDRSPAGCIGSSIAVGVLLGFSVTTEYTVALAAGIIGLFLIYELRNLKITSVVRAHAAAALGVALGLAPQLAYNWICFGAPWQTGYGHLSNDAFRANHENGILGIGLPTAASLYHLTVHPARGLFTQAPILLLSLPASVLMARDSRSRAAAWVCALAFAGHVLLISGFPAWSGGWTFAPRFLVPVLLLAMVPLASLPAGWRPILVLLGAISIVQMAVPTLGDPLAPSTWIDQLLAAGTVVLPVRGSSPIWGYCWNFLIRRGPAPNLGTHLGLSPASSIGLLAFLAGSLFVAASRFARSKPQ